MSCDLPAFLVIFRPKSKSDCLVTMVLGRQNSKSPADFRRAFLARQIRRRSPTLVSSRQRQTYTRACTIRET